jgi:hypothetical protein
VAEEIGNQRFHHCQSLFVRNGVGFQAFGKIVLSNLEVSVSLLTLCKGPCYIDGYPFKQGVDVVLEHLDPISGSGAANGYADVALWAPHLDIVSCLEPVVLLLDLIQGLIDTKENS